MKPAKLQLPAMKTQTLGQSPLAVSQIAFGCMRISGTWNPSDFTPAHEEMGRQALLAAYESGYTLFDHADIYGRTLCESIHGRLLAESPDLKSKTTIATKCGIRFGGDPTPSSPHRWDFSKSHIIESAERSLERLQINQIDLFQLHRPDLLMDPMEIAEAFQILADRKLVKFFGVSNFRPSMVDLLNANLPEPLIVNQIEISLDHLAPFEDGQLDSCLIHDLTPLAWSPLAGGWLGSSSLEPSQFTDRNAKLHALLGDFSKKYNTSRQNIALSFLLKHPSHVIPIIGTTNPERIKDAALAAEIELSREDWYQLFTTAKNQPLP
jgi:predicted oxidoreductase